MSKLTLPHIRRARKAFKQSLSHKTDFSPSFTGLARTFTSEWLVTAQGNDELLHLAEQHALRAIERDPGSAAGHRELGVTKLYLGDVDASVAALHLAEELSPHFADVIYSHADTLVHASRPGDALAKIRKAISLNPIAPDAYLWCAAGASFFLEQYEEAIAYVDAMKDKRRPIVSPRPVAQWPAIENGHSSIGSASRASTRCSTSRSGSPSFPSRSNGKKTYIGRAC